MPLGQPQYENVLKEYCLLFTFDGRIDESLREFLSCFRLPGESQQIERILEHFSTTYYANYAQHHNLIANSDAVLILSYSIVMLNTDLYNQQNQKKMTLQQFISNLRNTNNNNDFDVGLLTKIYNAIAKHEIIMPGEKDDLKHYFHFYNQVIQPPAATKHNNNSNSNRCIASSVFNDNWGSFLSSMVYCFDYTDDAFTLLQLQKGIMDYATCAHGDALHCLIGCLCCMTGIYPGYATGTTTAKPHMAIKGQLALYLLIMILKQHGNSGKIKEWHHVCALLNVLFTNDLLQIKGHNPYFEQQLTQEESLFTSLSQYFSIQPTTNTVVLPKECDLVDVLMHHLKTIDGCMSHLIQNSLIVVDNQLQLTSFAVQVVELLIHHSPTLSDTPLVVKYMQYLVQHKPVLGLYFTTQCIKKQTPHMDQYLTVLDDALMADDSHIPDDQMIQYLNPILSFIHPLNGFQHWLHSKCHMPNHHVLKELQELLFKLGPLDISHQLRDTSIQLIKQSIQYLQGDVELVGQYLDLHFHTLDMDIQPYITSIYNRDADVRQKAWFYLQKKMIGNLDSDMLLTLINHFAFTLATTHNDAELLEELRMRATAMICKTYLMFNSRVDGFDVDHLVLRHMIDLLKGYYQSATLIEIIPEAIKNILLILQQQRGILEDKDVWEALTFIPGLKEGILNEDNAQQATQKDENIEEEVREEKKMDPSKPIYI